MEHTDIACLLAGHLYCINLSLLYTNCVLVLHMGRSNRTHQYRLGAGEESESALEGVSCDESCWCISIPDFPDISAGWWVSGAQGGLNLMYTL